MRKTDIELWALKIIEQVNAGQPIEDSVVEIKGDYPDSKKAARRIAGHANAARCESILWLLGVDEDKGVIGINEFEFSDWWSQVKAQFEGVVPELIDINVSVEGKIVKALFFETDRPPYVVKNPDYGVSITCIAYEVPWREGTSIRSAKHGDLLKILVPVSYLPEIEIFNARLNLNSVKPDSDSLVLFSLSIETYIIPNNKMPLVIPCHRCKIEIETIDSDFIACLDKEILIKPPTIRKTNMSNIRSAEVNEKALSVTAFYTPSEIFINGPGCVNITAESENIPLDISNLPSEIVLKCVMKPAGIEKDIKMIIPFKRVSDANELDKYHHIVWRYHK